MANEDEVTIGLIDALISICRVLATRDLISSHAVREALLDLDDDEDFGVICDAATDALLLSTKAA